MDHTPCRLVPAVTKGIVSFASDGAEKLYNAFTFYTGGMDSCDSRDLETEGDKDSACITALLSQAQIDVGVPYVGPIKELIKQCADLRITHECVQATINAVTGQTPGEVKSAKGEEKPHDATEGALAKLALDKLVDRAKGAVIAKCAVLCAGL